MVLSCTSIVAQEFQNVAGFEEVSQLENTNGVSMADYDQDGDLDIYLVSVRKFDPDNPLSWSRLLRNDGEGGFTDVTEMSNLLYYNPTVKLGTMGDRFAGSWGDYDNDGFPDLFLANNGGDELWHNEGDGTFVNVTDISGVQGCLDCYSSNGLWWDYDLDGDLDLYVSDWIKDNRQFENNGDRTFTDVSNKTRLDDYSRTYSALPLDVNKDKLPDLYVVNDFDDNRLFVNDGSGLFEDKTKEYGLENDGEGMGVDIGDYNNDGFFDIYVTNIYDREPNPFFIGNKNGVFVDQASELGVEDTGWGWATRFFDADHDMDEDIYVVNGFFLTGGIDNKNMFFLNEEDGFRNVAYQRGIDGIEQARGMEVFDFDLDGDLDILVGNRNANLTFHKNLLMESEETDKNWIQIQLEGTHSNRDAYGSIVRITCQNKHYYRCFTGANIFGQSLKPIHFGLAGHDQVDQIQVTWPDGTTEAFESVAANQIVRLKEGEGEQVINSILNLEVSGYDKIMVYPNPVEEVLYLRPSQKMMRPIWFELIDISGRQIFSKKIDTGTKEVFSVDLQIHGLAPGIYTYTIQSKNLNQSGRLVKNP